MCPPVPRSTSRCRKCPAAVDHTAEVDVEHPVPLIGGRVQELSGLADAGVVDHDVGHAVLRADLVGEPLDRLGVGRRRAGRRARRRRARRSRAAVSFTLASSMSLTTSSAPSRANASAVSRPMPLPAPVTETSVSPKYSRGRPTCARSSARLGGLPVEVVDEFADRPRQHLRMRHRRPVPGLDVAAPQPRHPIGDRRRTDAAGQTDRRC